MQALVKIITKILNFLYIPFRKVLPEDVFRYGMCGGGNMVLDWVLYFLFYHYVVGTELVYIHWLGLGGGICLSPHIATLCIVFPITLLTGFWLNKYITFVHSSLKGWNQLCRYILIVCINLLINYLGLKLCVDLFGWYPTPSKIVVTLVTVLVSFFGQKYFSFSK